MSRRSFAWLGLLLLVALVAGWLWRARSSGPMEPPRAAGGSTTEPARLDDLDHGKDRSLATEDRSDGFESLARVPGHLLLLFRNGSTLAAVAGAEVFVLEGTEPDWPRWEQASSDPPFDLEADVRSRGRRLTSDEH